MTDYGVPPAKNGYRLDRRYVLTTIGVQVVGAGFSALLAFWIWGPLGVLSALLLLNAARLAVWPPTVARTDPEGAHLGGPVSARPVHVKWADVEDVSIGRGMLTFDRGEASSVTFSTLHLGGRANEFVRDVHDRLNTANGYRRFDPRA